MDNRIKSLADVKLPGKEELRTIVFEKYMEQDVWELPFTRCLVTDAIQLLEQGRIVKVDIACDCYIPADNFTDIMWVLEFENKDVIYYILLKCITEPSEDDMVYGYSHMVFERYDFESFPKYI